MYRFDDLAQPIHVPAVENTEALPFTIKVVHTPSSLAKAIYIREHAYGRHVPELARSLATPEVYDHQPGTVILLAESKLDGEPIGTMRIQTNLYQPLNVESSIHLPVWLEDRALAEATRLGVARGRVGSLAKAALFKAFYQYCVHAEIDWMVITARSPLDRQYESLLFQDVLENGDFVPMRHIGDIPHRVMALDVGAAHARWTAAKHPLLGFMTETVHPDIQVTSLPQPASRGPRIRMGSTPTGQEFHTA